MSAVKAALAKTDGQFISLHETLSRMVEIDGCTYQEAATLLLRLLYPLQGESEELWQARRPEGVYFLSGRGIASAMGCLRQAAAHGEPSETDDNELPF